MSNIDIESKAYSLGYSHGYEHGVEENPYDHDDINRVYYKQGYDAGCGDYCRDELDGGEDENIPSRNKNIQLLSC